MLFVTLLILACAAATPISVQRTGAGDVLPRQNVGDVSLNRGGHSDRVQDHHARKFYVPPPAPPPSGAVHGRDASDPLVAASPDGGPPISGPAGDGPSRPDSDGGAPTVKSMDKLKEEVDKLDKLGELDLDHELDDAWYYFNMQLLSAAASKLAAAQQAGVQIRSPEEV